MARFTPFCAFVCIVAGCASADPKMADIAPAIPAAAQHEGRIYFYRPFTLIHAGLRGSEVALNGRVLGPFMLGGAFFVDELPGEKKVSFGGGTGSVLRFALRAGETRYVRARENIGASNSYVDGVLVEDSVGEREVLRARYVGRLDLLDLPPPERDRLECERLKRFAPPLAKPPPYTGTSADNVAAVVVTTEVLLRLVQMNAIARDCRERRGLEPSGPD